MWYFIGKPRVILYLMEISLLRQLIYRRTTDCYYRTRDVITNEITVYMSSVWVLNFFFEVNQWVDFHWKLGVGSGRNFRFVPWKPIIILWSEEEGWQLDERCHVWELEIASERKANRKNYFALLSVKRYRWKCPGLKRSDRVNSPAVETQLSFQMKKPGDKKAKKKGPKNIYPELTKFFIAN